MMISFGMLRTMANGDSEAIGSYKDFFKYKGAFIQGELSDVDSEKSSISIKTSNGESVNLQYDELVLCTGTSLNETKSLSYKD